MDPSDLLSTVAETLDRARFEYFVTGSVATIMYGEPRFTNDIDIVVRLRPEHATAFCSLFPPDDYYVDAQAVEGAARSGGQFNVIHPASGFKIDFMIASDDEFDRSRFDRRRTLPFGTARRAPFASPEDVIVRKLQYFAEGGSDKHLRDIRGILSMSGDALDRAYLQRWIDRFGLREHWSQVEDA